MQKQSDKTIEEKRLEAQMALEGGARRKAREEEEQRKIEGERRRKEEEIRQKQERERRMREEEERKKLEEKRKKEAEERKKREEIVKKKEEEERKKDEEAKEVAKKEALLKKMRPPGRPLQPAPKEEKVQQRVPTKREATKKSKIPQIRTYESDVAEAVSKQGESLVKIAVAEKKEARKKKQVKKAPAPKKATVKILMVVIGIVILVTSGGVLISQLNKKGVFSGIFDGLKRTGDKEIMTPAPTTIMPSLITANTEKKIAIPEEREAVLDIIKKELRETSGTDSIKNIYLLETSVIATDLSTDVGGGENKVQNVASVGKLLSIWQHNMPALLSRSLSKEFMLGIYSSISGVNTPFLIFTTNSYRQTFAGMFAWENAIFDDFYNLFGLESRESSGVFLDSIVNDKDVRVLKSTGGETVLLYSFVDENTVVITTNEATFNKVLYGLSK